MDREIEQEEIKPLILNYIFHIILFILYFALHLIAHSKLFWIINSLGILFLVGSYLNILYFTFPIYPFIIILKKKYNKKNFYLLRIMTLILLIISLFFGLIISIVFLINTIKSKTFYKECPFNLGIEHLNAVFGPYFGKNERNDDIKSKCAKRRCILDNENMNEIYPFSYLCNYNANEDFDDDDETYTRQNEDGDEISVDKQLICTLVSQNYNSIIFSQSELYLYLDLCYYYEDFYRCKRFNKPEEYYDLDLDTECPNENYLILIYNLCVFVIILDIIFAILPWGIEYLIYKKLFFMIGINRRKANSNCSTARSSVISKDEESFKKEVTPIIIIEPGIRNNNLFNVDNNIDNDNELELRLKNEAIKINKINLNEREKIPNKRNYINNIQNAERNKLNDRNISIDIQSDNKDMDLNVNKESKIEGKNRIIIYQQNTTINPNINSIIIKNDNKDS